MQTHPTCRPCCFPELATNPVYPMNRLVDLDDLTIKAIQATKVIVPPDVMLVTGTPRFVVLDGHRRIAAAKRLGVTSLQCHVFNVPWTPEEAFIRLQAVNDEGYRAKRRAQEDADRASMGLPVLTEAEHEALESERDEAADGAES